MKARMSSAAMREILPTRAPSIYGVFTAGRAKPEEGVESFFRPQKSRGVNPRLFPAEEGLFLK
jgi:hypothetical protein